MTRVGHHGRCNRFEKERRSPVKADPDSDLNSHGTKHIQMNKIILCALFALLGSFTASAQYLGGPPAQQPGATDPGNRLFFGGNFGMSFGSSTFVNVSPLVGYRFNNYFAAGGGVNFIYSSFSYKNGSGSKLYTDSYGTAGLGIFGRVFPVKFLFAQVRPELNYVWGKTKYFYGNLPETKYPGKFVPSVLVGGGVAMPAGRGAIMLSLDYDIVQDKRSPYGTQPFVSIGFTF
jgi:hypothetical protein